MPLLPNILPSTPLLSLLIVSVIIAIIRQPKMHLTLMVWCIRCGFIFFVFIVVFVVFFFRIVVVITNK